MDNIISVHFAADNSSRGQICGVWVFGVFYAIRTRIVHYIILKLCINKVVIDLTFVKTN